MLSVQLQIARRKVARMVDKYNEKLQQCLDGNDMTHLVIAYCYLMNYSILAHCGYELQRCSFASCDTNAKENLRVGDFFVFCNCRLHPWLRRK